MATIYLSGCETPKVLADVIRFGGTHVMLSFYELHRGRSVAPVLDVLEANKHVKVFINAGARAVAAHGADPSDFFRAYKRFLREYGHLLEYATELDMDGFLPQQYDSLDMAEWRETLLALDTVPIVPIWHGPRGRDGWQALCDDPHYPRLGLGSTEAAAQPSLPAQFIGQAKNSGKTVHGFGQTKILTTLKVLRYASIDSRSWKSGERFGTLYIFHQHQWKELSATTRGGKAAREPYREYFKAIGCSWRKIVADDPRELRKANVIAWTNLSKRLQVIYGGLLGTKPDASAEPPSELHQQLVASLKAAKTPDSIPDATVDTTPRITKLVAKKKNHESMVVDRTNGMLPVAGNTGADAAPRQTRTTGKQSDAASETGTVQHVDRQPANRESGAQDGSQIIPLKLVKSDVSPMSVELMLQEGGKPDHRLVKGMMGSDTFLNCSTCSIGALCPKYSEGSACAYTTAFRNMPTRNLNEVSTALAMLVEENASRFRMARVIEQTLGGGMPSKETTELSQVLANQLSGLAKVMKSTKAAKVTGDSEGLWSKIFGDLGTAPVTLQATTPDAIDAQTQEVDPTSETHSVATTTAEPVAQRLFDDDDESGDVPASRGGQS